MEIKQAFEARIKENYTHLQPVGSVYEIKPTDTALSK
jgi:hypothetical protein